MLKKIQTLLTHSITVLLVSVAGFAIGLLIAAMYSVPKVPMASISFADIGGMLAGVGTVGLLIIALLTAQEWKKQSKYQHRVDALNDYGTKTINVYSEKLRVFDCMIRNYRIHEPFNIHHYKNDINQIMVARDAAEYSATKLESIWKLKPNSTPIPDKNDITEIEELIMLGSSSPTNIHTKILGTRMDLINNRSNTYKDLNQRYGKL
jgi:hypothetical protein